MSDSADKPDERLAELRAKWEHGHTVRAVLRMDSGFKVVVVSESAGAWWVMRYFEGGAGWMFSRDLQAGSMAEMFLALEKAVH